MAWEPAATYTSGGCTITLTSYDYNKTYELAVAPTSGGNGEMEDYASYDKTPWYNFANLSKVDQVVINTGVKKIGAYAFADPRITDLEWSGTVVLEHIGAHAFENCSKYSFSTSTIAPTIKYLGDYCFSGCNQENGYDIDLVLISKLSPDMYIGVGAFSNCPKLKGTLTIPAWMTSIPDHFMSGNTGIENVVLHDKVTSIGVGAFQNVGKTANTFQTLTLPTVSKLTIGANAFSGCPLKGNLTIPDNVVQTTHFTPSTNPFSGCIGITDVVLGLQYNDLSILQLPSVSNKFTKVVNKYAASQDLSALPVANAADTLNASCKIYGRTNNVGFKNGLNKFNASIDRWRDMAILQPKKFTLSNGTVDYTFNESADVGSMTIDVIGDLEDYTVDSCPWKNFLPVVTTVILAGTITKLGSYTLTGAPVTSIEMPPLCTKVGVGTFKDCTKLTTINQIAALTEVGASAFENCSALTSVDAKCNTIPNAAFKNCAALTSYSLSDDLISIEDEAFSGVLGTTNTEIQLPDTLTNIGSNVFNGNTTVTSIINGAPAQTVAADAFSGMSALTTIYGDPNNTRLVAAAGDKFADINTLALIVPFTYNGREAYPVTSSAAVKCTNDKTLDVILKEYENRLAVLESK